MNLDISKVKIAMINANLLTVEALGKKMGCSKQNLGQIFDRCRCRPKTAKKLADALNVPVEQIIKETTLEQFSSDALIKETTLEQFSSDALIDELKRRLRTRDARHENT